MADLGWRRRWGSSPAARRGARQRAGLTPACASNTLPCQCETLRSKLLWSIKNPIDSDHGIYREPMQVRHNLPQRPCLDRVEGDYTRVLLVKNMRQRFSNRPRVHIGECEKCVLRRLPSQQKPPPGLRRETACRDEAEPCR